MTKIKLSILFLLLIVVSSSIKASHIMGGDISYTCIAPGKFNISVKLYRDCRGIPLNSPTINVFCNSALPIALNYTRTSIKDITPVCKTTPTPCIPVNDSSRTEGVEEHIFEGVLDLNTFPYNAFKTAGCCEIYVSVEQCCRNGSITTINPGNFYTEAMINICNIGASSNTCNTSPVLSNKPIIYTCCNQPYRYNCGVFENTDGDSLSYELANPLSAHATNETYSGNFSSKYPVTPYCPPNAGTLNCTPLPNANPPRGFYFDSETGDIVFTPINCYEVGVVVIQIYEWRKDSANVWKKIGFTRRDIEIIVRDCGSTNTPPYFTTNTNKYSVCEGTKMCITIGTKDNNTNDTLDVKWLSGIPDATFRIIDTTAPQKQIEFCWTPKIGDARNNPYTFTVGVKDNNCPIVAEGSKSFNIFVKPRATANRFYTKKANNLLEFKGLNSNNNTFSWSFKDSADTTIFTSNKLNDSVTFSKRGKYTVVILVNNGSNCPTIYYDTIIMDGSITTKVNSYSLQKVKVYPNPSNSIINIAYNEQETYKNIRILDLSGKEILNSMPLTQIDISKMLSGIYILEINILNGKTFAKIIKQ